MPETEQPIAERRRALIAGLLFSAFMTLAFPPFGFWGFAFVSISPLVWCAATTKQPFRATLFVGIGSAPFWAFEHRWLVDVTMAGYPLVFVYLSLYAGLFVLIAGRLRLKGGFWAKPAVWFVAAALIWSGLETLRGEIVFYGYPWFYIGHPLIDAPLIPQNADLFGAAGISLFVAICGSLLTTVLTHKSRSWIGVGVLGMLAVVLGWNGFVTSAIVIGYGQVFNDNRVHVAIIQTDVPQSNKIAWSYQQKLTDFDRFVHMTREAANYTGDDAPLDLIVWPETMFPGLSLDTEAVRVERDARLRFPDGTPTTYFYDELIALQKEIDMPMLIGAIGNEGLHIEIDDATGEVSIDQYAMYNSVFLIDQGVVSEQRYDKVHLTPFGEVMPYISASDWLEEQLLDFGAQGMKFDLKVGDDLSAFHIPLVPVPVREANPPIDERPSTLRVATPICFEATMSGVVRRLVFDESGERQADVIVQLSNDGWFGRWRGGREQHLQLCRWRAIELRTGIVRAVNTGISASIDQDGQLLSVAGRSDNQPGEHDNAMVVHAVVPFVDYHTAYLQFGHWIPWFTLAFTALAVIVPMVPVGSRSDRSSDRAADHDPDDDTEGPANADPSDAPNNTATDPEPRPGGSA